MDAHSQLGLWLRVRSFLNTKQVRTGSLVDLVKARPTNATQSVRRDTGYWCDLPTTYLTASEDVRGPSAL